MKVQGKMETWLSLWSLGWRMLLEPVSQDACPCHDCHCPDSEKSLCAQHSVLNDFILLYACNQFCEIWYWDDVKNNVKCTYSLCLSTTKIGAIDIVISWWQENWFYPGCWKGKKCSFCWSSGSTYSWFHFCLVLYQRSDHMFLALLASRSTCRWQHHHRASVDMRSPAHIESTQWRSVVRGLRQL